MKLKRKHGSNTMPTPTGNCGMSMKGSILSHTDLDEGKGICIKRQDGSKKNTMPTADCSMKGSLMSHATDPDIA
jgi:hypothetical protein